MDATLKKQLKKKLPNFIIKKHKKNKLKLSYKYDEERFFKSYSSENYSLSNEGQLKSRLIFYAHSIEKGLSHTDLRYGFGKRGLKSLREVMVSYREKHYNEKDLAWQNSLSVLKAYQEIHKNKKDDLEYFNNLFFDFLEDIQSCTVSIGGATNVIKNKNNKELNFEELSQNRFSIREFCNEPVELKKIESAIELAMKTPSVCNRQSAKVRIIRNKEKIEKTLAIQGGFGGYALPPILMLVTSDIHFFVSEGERNQQYIDGGLFAMSLLYGLEYENLGACPLNAMLEPKKERTIRNILGIEDNESLIMFVAVGHTPNTNKVPKSFRYNAEDITTVI